MQSNNKVSTPPTPQERLAWHEKQITRYSDMVKSCKTMRQLRLILDRVQSHKAKAVALKIELNLQIA